MHPRFVRRAFAATLLALAVVASCTGDTGPGGPTGLEGPQGPQGPQGPSGTTGIEHFVATLDGASEAPPVATGASGTAAFTLIGDLLLYRVDVADIVAVSAAHIHGPAPVGVNAPIRVDLFPTQMGAMFTGTGTLARGVTRAPRAGVDLDSVMVLLRNGNAYVNVHTVANPGGELRGQIVQQP